jgi:hypothetical protein
MEEYLRKYYKSKNRAKNHKMQESILKEMRDKHLLEAELQLVELKKRVEEIEKDIESYKR